VNYRSVLSREGLADGFKRFCGKSPAEVYGHLARMHDLLAQAKVLGHEILEVVYAHSFRSFKGPPEDARVLNSESSGNIVWVTGE